MHLVILRATMGPVVAVAQIDVIGTRTGPHVVLVLAAEDHVRHVSAHFGKTLRRGGGG